MILSVNVCTFVTKILITEWNSIVLLFLMIIGCFGILMIKWQWHEHFKPSPKISWSASCLGEHIVQSTILEVWLSFVWKVTSTIWYMNKWIVQIDCLLLLTMNNLFTKVWLSLCSCTQGDQWINTWHDKSSTLESLCYILQWGFIGNWFGVKEVAISIHPLWRIGSSYNEGYSW